ncbi:pyridine nucleotide-disulphide oxidoreductase family protein [Stylonychia lemnae]|uniref:Pyridine nucleotide-disulphide oxidoreductase family protein n=1 Tax=Stylonychia lemnae TaxID=5949 RepID=A0A078AWG2_STYLE|nr:pyridine nucleotide-disulphide oxidoreductase family protein [Stylonychia lemnae]|eukprot:CDW86381.1 pyridine nucleotide-disulphide oxidoreductase family protein [Stylonychia lemnae]
MGGTCSKTQVAYDKKVIIVGCSFAGLTLAEQLWDYFDVTLIDKNDYFEYICTTTRSLVKDEHLDSITVSYVTMMRAHSKRAEFQQGTLMEIYPERNQILLQNVQTGEFDYRNYDFLVICTGSSYQQPTKFLEVQSLEERKSRLALEQEAIKRANSILVVGAGPVGVEIIGELVHANNQIQPDLNGIIQKKRLGIVGHGEKVLPNFVPKAQEYAQQFMTKNGVEIYMNTHFDENFNQTHKFEHVIYCQGSSYNTQFMQNSPMRQLSECVNSKGRIFVNDYLQVTNINPLQRPESNLSLIALSQKKTTMQHTEDLDKSQEVQELLRQVVFENIFCIGDVAQTSLNEEKTVYPLKQCANICAQNIITLTDCNDSKKQLKALPPRFDGVYQISLGPEDGFMIINNFVITGKRQSITKESYQNLYMQKYRGDEKAKKQIDIEMKKLEYLLWVCNSSCFQCCPCANTREGRRPNDEKQKMN